MAGTLYLKQCVAIVSLDSWLIKFSQMKGSRSVALTLDVHGTPAENLQVSPLEEVDLVLTISA